MRKHLKLLLLICFTVFTVLLISSFKNKKSSDYTDYKILYSNDIVKLKDNVKQNMSYGWQLQGSIAVSNNTYYQAMSR